MGSTLKKGTKVKVLHTALQGEVVRADTNSDVFGYVVAYTDPRTKESHERFFDQDDIEALPDEEPAGKEKK
jgi:hypothetical protein